jgi:hypothetical protein
MVPSSEKSTLSRLEICSGLYALTHRRSWPCGLFRPFQSRSVGQATIMPLARIWSESRSSTYCRRLWFTASFAVLGRRAYSSAFHWAAKAC